jgi:hypothetical protein
MKILTLLGILFMVSISCVGVNAQELKEFKVDSTYSVFAACQKQSHPNESLLFHLAKNNQTVFSLSTEASCIDNINLDRDFGGKGKVVILVSPSENIMPTSTELILVVDAEKETIFSSGMLPIDVDLMANGRFLYKEISTGSLFHIVYVLENDMIVIEKTAQLVFDGKVCITPDGDVKRYDDCSNGKLASHKRPVCIEKARGELFHFVAIEKCAINKNEVSDIRGY